LLVLGVSLALAAAAEQVKELKPQGYVNDFASVLSARTSSDLYQLCRSVEEKAGAQIAVVTIHSLGGLEASDFGNRLFAKWGVGHKDNRGILVLLAVDDRKYWVEVGYGLEPILNDAKVGDFGREMVPFLRKGDYDQGVLLLTSRIAEVIAKDRGVQVLLPAGAAPPRPVRRRPESAFGFPLLVILLILAFSVGPLFWPLLVLLFTGHLPRRGIWGSGASRGGWTSGGGWGGFGGGGGGFGGFGGGMSGGGGAGGSW